MDIRPARGLSRTLRKFTKHQVFADIADVGFIEGGAIARLECLAVLLEKLVDGNEACASQQEFHHDVCRPTELEQLMISERLRTRCIGKSRPNGV